jgi:hypothetical protein
MMKQIVFIILCVYLSACATQYDQRLVGTWKSNRADTVAEFNKRFPNRFNSYPEQKEKFAKIFGNMIQTFTLKDLTVEYEGSVFTVNYKVLEMGKDYVLIKTDGECGEEFKIRFDENFNSYWVSEDSAFPEKFSKIKTEQGNTADRQATPASR